MFLNKIHAVAFVASAAAIVWAHVKGHQIDRNIAKLTKEMNETTFEILVPTYK